jgi:hypothetical protein
MTAVRADRTHRTEAQREGGATFHGFALIGTYIEPTREDVGMSEELDLDKFDGTYSWDELYHMNVRFTAAMAAAVRSNLEHPPRVGIDHTPGTKNPMCYAVRGGEVRQFPW